MSSGIRALLIANDGNIVKAFETPTGNPHPDISPLIVSSLGAAQEAVRAERVDVVVSDCIFDNGCALDVLEIAENCPVIVLADPGDEEAAVTAMKAGASAFLVKDRDKAYLKLLWLSIDSVLKTKRMERQFSIVSQALGRVTDRMYIYDSDGNITYANDSLAAMFGYERADLIGKPVSLLFSQDNPAELLNEIQGVTPATNWQGEVCCRQADGRDFTALLSISGEQEQRSKAVSFSAVIRNVPRNENIEKAFIHSTSESGQISLLLIESDLAEQMAFTREVKNEKLPFETRIVHSVSEARLLIDRNKYDVVVTDYLLNDGNALDVLNSVKDLPVIIVAGAGNESTAVEAMKAGAFDYLIKDEKRSYLKTLPLTIKNAVNSKSGERRFKMLSHALMSIQESVWITDLRDNILFVNEAFLKNYGYTDAHDVIGKSITLVHSESTPQHVAQAIQLDTMCGGWEGELSSKRKDGSEFDIFLSTSIVHDDSGLPMAYTGVAKDISEQKNARKELQRAKDSAESANRSKSEFLANMSHEIRTPMNGVLGMTELLLDMDVSEEQREYLSMARASAESLLTIINDILDFSKIESGKFELNLIEFSLENKFKDILKSLELRARQKRVGFSTRISPQIPSRLIGDPVRLQQILINLIGNAIKFTAQGLIQYVVELKWIDGAKACLHFRIIDSGIGIPAEKQELIFDSFEQVDNSYSRGYQGTGLGLAISSKLVALMNGRIWVESPAKEFPAPGEGPGSIFQFEIVVGWQEETVLTGDEFRQGKDPAEAANPQSVKALAVLLVEDNLVNQTLAKRMLEKLGHTITVADNGKVALDRLENNQFDLVFMDIHMPVLDGFQATEAIRAGEKDTDKHLPIIALTANAMNGDKEKCLEAGMNGYVSKPIKKADLVSVIQEVLAPDSDSCR